MSPVRILLLDNHDSFTFNLAQCLGELGAAVEVVYSDAIGVGDVTASRCDAVVISPGPGAPGGCRHQRAAGRRGRGPPAACSVSVSATRRSSRRFGGTIARAAGARARQDLAGPA